MVFGKTLKCKATGKYYKVKGTLSYNNVIVVYLITCQCCKLQYVRSAINFKERFHIHKSGINTGKKRCGAAKHFLECCTNEGKLNNLKIYNRGHNVLELYNILVQIQFTTRKRKLDI